MAVTPLMAVRMGAPPVKMESHKVPVPPMGAASGWQGRVSGFPVDGENLEGCGCSTPRHSDHISLSSSLGDLKDTCQFPLWASGEGEVRILV